MFGQYFGEIPDLPLIVAGVQNASMRQVECLLERVAPQNFTVLITGETGTGKELIAHTLHKLSKRRNGPLVILNCAGIPDTMVEDELFGHVKGAFTDARDAHPGKIEQANHGTLFLDEIGDLSSPAQGKLLRAVELKEVTPIGGRKTITLDVRIVAATNRDLPEEAKHGRFRPDLYHRLYEFPIELPALRERNDVYLLAAHFFQTSCCEVGRQVPVLTHEAWQALLGYAWPGNIRQLRNAIRRTCIAYPQEVLGIEQFDELSASASEGSVKVGVIPSAGVTLAQIEKAAILRALLNTEGNRQAAARQLDIGPATLYRKLKDYGIDLHSLSSRQTRG